MTISELSVKAEFIADRHRRLQSQWHTYCNTLVQAITLSKYKLHHAISCEPEEGLRFYLFDHFIIRIVQAPDFNCHTINYVLETRDGKERAHIASAELDHNGLLDGRIGNQDRSAVLEHYLAKIGKVYDCLYEAIEKDRPLEIADITPEFAGVALA